MMQWIVLPRQPNVGANADIRASGTTANLRGYNQTPDFNFVNAYV